MRLLSISSQRVAGNPLPARHNLEVSLQFPWLFENRRSSVRHDATRKKPAISKNRAKVWDLKCEQDKALALEAIFARKKCRYLKHRTGRFSSLLGIELRNRKFVAKGPC